MCEILDRVENRGIQRGIEWGIEQERQRFYKEMTLGLRMRGWSDEDIADHLHVPVVDVRIWHGTLDS